MTKRIGIIGALIIGVMLLYHSYALFTTSQINKSAITIKVGTMNGTIKVDGTITNKLTLEKGAKQTFVVTLENLNAVDGKFLPYYIGDIPDGVTFGYLEETGIDVPIEETLLKNGKRTYSIYFENNSNSSVTITLGVQGGLLNQPLSLPSNGKMIPKTEKVNKNISNVWKYDETTGSSTFCVTGLESTCVELVERPNTYLSGTIIKYKVNDTTEKYFHVMFDNGDTLTLQQRENTVEAIAWYNTQDNTKGPLTALSQLENTTKNWTNVLDQTYTLGSTIFNQNPYTGCNTNDDRVYSCTSNTYILPSRTAKARMITVQEALALGCTIDRQSCPVWMYNYLENSTKYGGTVNGNYAYYWTNSTINKASSIAYEIHYSGYIGFGVITSLYDAIRAVVVISK